ACVDHPGRAVAATCLRCGRFVCDWCVKLAPSWGHGLCLDCQKKKGAGTVRSAGNWMTGPLLLAGVALLISPSLGFFRIWETIRAVGAGATLTVEIAYELTTLSILSVCCAVGAVFYFLRKRWAPTLVRVVYGLVLVDAAVVWSAGNHEGPVLV